MVLYNSEKLIKNNFDIDNNLQFSGSSKFKYLRTGELIEKTKQSTNEIDEYWRYENRKRIFRSQQALDKLSKEFRAKNQQSISNVKYYKLNKSKVRKKLYSYFNTDSCKKRISFVTITFPTKTHDDLCYKMFNLWLTNLRTKNLIVSYLWVAERQKKGTIHFHLLTSDYVKVTIWNELMRSSLKRAKKRDPRLFNNYNPTLYNGIDLAKNRKTGKVVNFAKTKDKNALSKYITKYVTKNDVAMTHLCWHCSRNISVLFSYVISDVSDSVFKKVTEDKSTFVVMFDDVQVYIPKSGITADMLVLMFSVNQLLFDTFS